MEEDWFLLPYELRLQRAHVATLAAAGIVSSDEKSALDAALCGIEADFADRPCPETPAEDIHTWLETLVTEKAGDAGKKLHTARSRNDQVATLLKLYAIDAAEQLRKQLGALTRAFSEQAKQWADAVAPMQTHAQFAAPGSMGFWALRYAAAFRGAQRVLGLLVGEWKNECPLGSGAVAGSSIPIDRGIQASELGFAGPSPNALYSTTARDEILQLLSICSQIALHLQSFAADVLAFCQTPFAWVNYPMAFGTGSSMMPNKANPDAMELLRGRCCAIESAYIEMMLLIKGTPSGYNRDLQLCKPLLHGTVEETLSMTGLVADFIRALSFREERLRNAAASGAIGATLAMETLVRQGIPLRDAHRRVSDALSQGDEVALAIDRYVTIGSASPDETRRIARQFLAELEQNT